MKLTLAERLILWNQYRILEMLAPANGKEEYQRMQTVVGHGFEGEYDSISAHIYKDSSAMTAQECKEVLDIMSMHRALHNSFTALADKTGIDPDDIKFRGFDGNDSIEGKYLAYTQYFCSQPGGRFVELERGDDFNSHSEMLEVYRRMLFVWTNELNQKPRLSKDEIQRIIAAQAYPQ